MVSACMTASGFLKKDVYDAISNAIDVLLQPCPESTLNLEEDHVFNQKTEFICCLVAELHMHPGEPADAIASFLVDRYAVCEAVDGNLWTARRIDELLSSLPVDGKLTALCELALLIARAVRARSTRKAGRDTEYIMNGGLLEVDPGSGLLLLDRSLDAPRPPQRTRASRTDVIKSLSAHLASGDASAARAVVTATVGRCGRTVAENNSMHRGFFSEVSEADGGTRLTDGGDLARTRLTDNDKAFWLPLRFACSADECSSSSSAISAKSRSLDLVWGLWRTLYRSTTRSSVQEFIARLASIYAFRWTSAKRHVRLNIILYACTVATRGRVRCTEPDDDFAEIVDVAMRRVHDVFVG
jgi:hypothetical protein